MYVYVICKYIVYVYYVCMLCMICILSCISVLYIFIYPSILPYVCTLCVYYVCMQSMCLYICIVYLLCISCIFILSKFVCPSTHLSSVCPCILDTMQVYYISNQVLYSVFVLCVYGACTLFMLCILLYSLFCPSVCLSIHACVLCLYTVYVYCVCMQVLYCVFILCMSFCPFVCLSVHVCVLFVYTSYAYCVSSYCTVLYAVWMLCILCMVGVLLYCYIYMCVCVCVCVCLCVCVCVCVCVLCMSICLSACPSMHVCFVSMLGMYAGYIYLYMYYMQILYTPCICILAIFMPICPSIYPSVFSSHSFVHHCVLCVDTGHVHKYEASLWTLENWEKYLFSYKMIIFNITVSKISEDIILSIYKC